MSDISIVEVKSRSQLRKFVDLPNKMYKDDPYYVPSLYGDDLSDWNRKKNPAFKYCDAKAFLAYKDGEIVGRIGAILSHKANETWNTSRMRFSQVDFIDDYEVSKKLFEAVENWAREMGCTQVHGPLGFSDLDREGMLIEGFQEKSLFYTYYSHPYYKDHLERLGYDKDTDWVEFRLDVPAYGSPTYERMRKISDIVLKRGRFHKADFKRRSQIKNYIRKVFELVNIAYSQLYGVVELIPEQIERYTGKFLPLVDPDYACIVLDEQEEIAGFGVACPSMSDALRKSKGRLFPLGWIRVLKALRGSDEINLLLIAVRPELQGAGINAVIIDHVINSCIRKGVKFAETGPQLETNFKVTSQWKDFDLKNHKRRRCFIKNIR